MEYDPDLIVWLTTLEAFPTRQQLEIPLVKANPETVNRLINTYALSEFEKIETARLEYTLFSQRRNIADRVNLQRYGFLWSATGIDQVYPEQFNPAQRDFPEPKEGYYHSHDGDDLEANLAEEIIFNTIAYHPGTDFVLINEPILISTGENSDVQYNYYYPKWAYDHYRSLLQDFTEDHGVEYYDLWDLVPEDGFTNSAIHLDVDNEKLLASVIYENINKHLD